MKIAASRSEKENERGVVFFFFKCPPQHGPAGSLLPAPTTCFPEGRHYGGTGSGCFPGGPNFAICMRSDSESWWQLLPAWTKLWQLLIEEGKALKSPAENVPSPKNHPVFLHGIDLQLLI